MDNDQPMLKYCLIFGLQGSFIYQWKAYEVYIKHCTDNFCVKLIIYDLYAFLCWTFRDIENIWQWWFLKLLFNSMWMKYIYQLVLEYASGINWRETNLTPVEYEEMKSISAWLQTNKLTLNLQKTHYIIFTRKKIKRS